MNDGLFSNSRAWWTAWTDRRPLGFQWLPRSNDFLSVDSNAVIVALLSLHPFTICITGSLCSLATVSITSIVTPTWYKKCRTSNTYIFVFTALYSISLFTSNYLPRQGLFETSSFRRMYAIDKDHRCGKNNLQSCRRSHQWRQCPVTATFRTLRQLYEGLCCIVSSICFLHLHELLTDGSSKEDKYCEMMYRYPSKLRWDNKSLSGRCR